MAGLLILVVLSTTTSSAAPINEMPTAPAVERNITVGAGAAMELDATMAWGPSMFVEYEALDGRLELELGGQLIDTPDGRELSADLLLKWPRRLASYLEVMVGAGPAIVGATRATHTSWGIEIAGDVMWWPTGPFGFWIEPSYEILFRDGLASAVGCTAGPIFRW